MNIRRIESFQVPPRWILVRVETSDDRVGWGEAIFPKRVRAVRGAIADMAANIAGAPAGAIEDLWQRLYRGGFFRRGPVLMTALAAIEQALWDIKGRRYGLAVHEFFGGPVRHSIRAYAGIGGEDAERLVAEARARKAAGYRAVKFSPTGPLHYLDDYERVESAVRNVAAVREALGPDFGIALDFHGRVHRAMAKILLRELEPLHPLWVEEPLLPEHGDLLAELAGSSSIPLAAGERLVDRWDFKAVFEARALAIVQPDVSLTGIHELEKISRMAEAYDCAVAPHCPNGPLSLAATLQVDAAVPNAVWQEQSLNLPYNRGAEGPASVQPGDYLTNPAVLTPVDGALAIPPGPGLGVEVDEARVRAADRAWQVSDMAWRNADGTLAEW